MTEPSLLGDIQFSDLSEWAHVGKGSFGKVYRCDYLGTEVAVKECLYQTSTADQKYVEREVEMLKEARHPNIVQFMGICTRESTVYIVTEFVPNGNLKDWISKEAEFFENISEPLTESSIPVLSSFRLRLSFIIDILRAVAYLHSHSILHRDLKLENLLLTENNRVKVCDFGFSRMAAKNEMEQKRISFCGTDSYMAPEIILCINQYDSMVDIFSFGVVLLSILSLKIPRNGGASDDPPFKRVIPGFGLDEAAIEVALDEFIPYRDIFLRIINTTTAVEPSKRTPIKEILPEMKSIEQKILEKIHEAEKTIPPTPGVDKKNNRISLHTGVVADFAISPSLPQVDGGSIEGILLSGSNTQLSKTAATTSASELKLTTSLLTSYPHRFSLVRAPLTATGITCTFCSKSIYGLLTSYLVCDDCGFISHKKCSTKLTLSCIVRHSPSFSNLSTAESSSQQINTKKGKTALA